MDPASINPAPASQPKSSAKSGRTQSKDTSSNSKPLSGKILREWTDVGESAIPSKDTANAEAQKSNNPESGSKEGKMTRPEVYSTNCR